MPDPFLPAHLGRAWSGHAIEDECPCPQVSCGLVANPNPACRQHSPRANRTMRQIHDAQSCPAAARAVPPVELAGLVAQNFARTYAAVHPERGGEQTTPTTTPFVLSPGTLVIYTGGFPSYHGLYRIVGVCSCRECPGVCLSGRGEVPVRYVLRRPGSSVLLHVPATCVAWIA